jgi:hypothetical protein
MIIQYVNNQSGIVKVEVGTIDELYGISDVKKILSVDGVKPLGKCSICGKDILPGEVFLPNWTDSNLSKHCKCVDNDNIVIDTSDDILSGYMVQENDYVELKATNSKWTMYLEGFFQNPVVITHNDAISFKVGVDKYCSILIAVADLLLENTKSIGGSSGKE